MRKTRWKIKRIAKLIYQYGWMWCDDIIVRPILYISSSSSNSGSRSSTTPYHSRISLVTNEPVYRKHQKHRKRWKHRRKIIKNNTHTQTPHSSRSTSNTQKHIYTLRMIFPLFFLRAFIRRLYIQYETLSLHTHIKTKNKHKHKSHINSSDSERKRKNYKSFFFLLFFFLLARFGLVFGLAHEMFCICIFNTHWAQITL